MAHAVNTVVVTGFGPFKTHKINSSWEVAKELSNLGLELYGINLVIEEIPVLYGTVEREVPALWEEFLPKLVVHLGLTSVSREVKIETLAHRSGYNQPDNSGTCPLGGSCKGKEEVLCSQLDLVRVIKKLREIPDMRVRVDLSCDAGRYVCEFTYFTSLNVNNSRTVFVHVPDIDKPYSVKEMAHCVKYIILYLLDEISKSSEHFKTKM